MHQGGQASASHSTTSQGTLNTKIVTPIKLGPLKQLLVGYENKDDDDDDELKFNDTSTHGVILRLEGYTALRIWKGKTLKVKHLNV